MKTRLFIYLFFSILLFSFKPNGKCNQQCKASNAFRTIAVTIPIKGFINTCHTERVEDGRVLNLSPAPLLPEENYLLLSDAEASLTDAHGKEFYFVGYNSYGQERVREKYTIVNDHGHVVLVKGDTNIKIKPGC